jgi:hypothetical protein
LLLGKLPAAREKLLKKLERMIIKVRQPEITPVPESQTCTQMLPHSHLMAQGYI